MSLVLRILALILVMFISRNADLLDNAGNKTQRSIENINEGWQYLEKNISDLKLATQDPSWTSIDLPHTWNQWDAVDNSPGYRRDASWYRKTLQLDPSDGVSYLLYFEGSNISTDVYVNGELAGNHVGGYVGFEIDITKYLKTDGQQDIMIRVDNSYNPEIIPSQKSDFFIYGGLTRDVWVKKVPNIHIANAKIHPTSVTKITADAIVEVNIAQAEKCQDCKIMASLIDPESRQIVSENTIDLKNQKSLTLELPTLSNPKLWSPKSPNLYELEVALIKGDDLHDSVKDHIGFRFYKFEKNGPFFLNGERVLLRGTHRHEEHAGFGAAMPNELHRKDIEQIKDLGANFLRLGHYPQDPEIYKACDELGIIVWDELPWCRGGVGNQIWKDNGKRLLQEQISQNINHPSIFFWSLGNEVYWLPDFENGDDTQEINKYLTELNNIAHEMDPSRLTAIRKYYDGADLVDVFSPSIWSGWYAGVYTGYEKSIQESMEKYPAFLHMEYGGSSHVGRHTENPITGSGMLSEDDWEEVSNQVNIKNIAKEGDWTENYIVDLFDWHLSVSETMPDFTGNAQWAFKDFGTPLRPENSIPYLNQKGLVDRNGEPKDAYFVFKSYWSDEPMIYIESHTWTRRQGPENKEREVCIYSNCESVELILNGQSLGTKDRKLGDFPASGLRWNIRFDEGANELKAMGYKGGKVVAEDKINIDYTYNQSGNPDIVQLQSHLLPNGNTLVEAFMMDKDGNRVLDYEGRMYFSLDGSGRLLKDYGTPTRSQVIEMANGRAAIEVELGEGPAVIEARNQDFKGSYLNLKPVEAKAQVVMKIQPVEYNDTEKTKISGPYRDMKKVSVPKTLTGQNKWFMFEGPVLENDKVAYRYYADYRHRFDIYGKQVNDLVMDTVSWDYHNLMNWGSDILKVGNSLGMGSPGIYYNDSVYTLSDWNSKEIEVIESGGDVAQVRTIFNDLKIGGKTFTVIQDWRLKTGDFWSEIEMSVKDGQLPEDMKWVTGVVKHLPHATSGNMDDHTYLYTYGEQSFHHQDLGMAVMASNEEGPVIIEDELSHLMLFENAGKKLNYRFMASWAEGINGPKTEYEFRKQVVQACQDK
ncbi:DUF4861 family protein [Portibacter marinus]|uniref:DUF4861 family protein n=1 Tax=Portibacter marinus TaxID=2898660 RepID=UPI001F2D1A15|nr:DUF4861 family protein [Portibacter marinus]